MDKKKEKLKTRKKIRSKMIIGIIVLSIFFNTNFSYGNLKDNEKINIQEIKEETIQTVQTINDKPKINSRIALVYDRKSGKVLYEKNGNRQTPMASTTKIMTAIVVVEQAKLNDVVTINAKAATTGGSRLGLKKNDRITVQDLLYGLMLCSGNDAAVALAIHVGGSIEGFADLMNKKSQEMGLINTNFVVPHGLDMKEHYTTAYELAKIADYALNINKIKEIVGTKTYQVTINNQSKMIQNTNELLGNLNGVYGVKTGFTNGAGRCLVTSCKRNDMDIITVIIGADTKKQRTADSIQLIEYINKNYKIVNIREIIEEKFTNWKKINQRRITINKGVTKELEIELEKIQYEEMAVKNTQVDNIEIEISSLFYLEAPVLENTTIGNLKIKVGEEVIDVLNIYNKEEIKKKEIQDYLLEFLKVYQKVRI